MHSRAQKQNATSWSGFHNGARRLPREFSCPQPLGESPNNAQTNGTTTSPRKFSGSWRHGKIARPKPPAGRGGFSRKFASRVPINRRALNTNAYRRTSSELFATALRSGGADRQNPPQILGLIQQDRQERLSSTAARCSRQRLRVAKSNCARRRQRTLVGRLAILLRMVASPRRAYEYIIATRTLAFRLSPDHQRRVRVGRQAGRGTWPRKSRNRGNRNRIRQPEL